MATTTFTPIRGSTAMGPADAPGDSARRTHPRHLLGSAMRAIGVFADTAFRIVVLGTDGTKQREQPLRISQRSGDNQE
ncbi:hypothetical protein ACFOSC_26795 [Streptantibioticus rubrisoli]|uniref:Uncharacterized protein n=1 Tax=Streptantibioticus rubrisoli TaxID=1387313 RepID=A0ABT1PLN8_9ACTN|nr:hypothetical protein [Streptantibioticus rubrisoli]MCQ4046265.1 hypothetical protein [Streptantibioticus rubrisoli]